MNELYYLLLPALLSGLLGSGHCIAMCGGIVSALGLSTKNRWLGVGYNLGRVGTYVLIGAITGAAASFLPTQALMPLRIIAALLVIAVGLYITGWWRVLIRLEAVGQGVWRHLQPLTKKVMPINSLPRALAAGAVWGWLPCGLVYSMLGLSIATQSASMGALVMLFFGLGTLPSMLGATLFLTLLQQVLRSRWFPTVAGVSVILMGVWMLLSLLGVAPHAH
ncbi:sulfite exporter TauE/SafE family protein [Salinispirillum sp. LH 10-3-1]|uniref:Sulfite exporter TauE/SafE family protein n=1 Tax=Salinispirillum sp. LH 10-3-1 TaxID=2952525 RepID=A0AB38YD78_9GAMM